MGFYKPFWCTVLSTVLNYNPDYSSTRQIFQVHHLKQFMKQNYNLFTQVGGVLMWNYCNNNHGFIVRDRPQLFGHRQALSQQLTVCDDPALVLHLTVLLLFQSVTQTMLQASGRFVSTVLQFLTTHLSQDVNDCLQKYHGNLTFFLISSVPTLKLLI